MIIWKTSPIYISPDTIFLSLHILSLHHFDLLASRPHFKAISLFHVSFFPFLPHLQFGLSLQLDFPRISHCHTLSLQTLPYRLPPFWQPSIPFYRFQFHSSHLHAREGYILFSATYVTIFSRIIRKRPFFPCSIFYIDGTDRIYSYLSVYDPKLPELTNSFLSLYAPLMLYSEVQR